MDARARSQLVSGGASRRPPGGAARGHVNRLATTWSHGLLFLQCHMVAGKHVVPIHTRRHSANAAHTSKHAAPASLPRAVVVLPTRGARGLLVVGGPAILLLRLLGVVLAILLLAIAVLLPSWRRPVAVLLPLLCLLSLALHLKANLQQLGAVYVRVLAHPQPAVGQVDVFDSLQQEQKVRGAGVRAGERAGRPR